MKDYPSLGAGQPATDQVIADLRDLFGSVVLLLPIQYGDKKPILKGWSNLSPDKMQEPEYLRQLEGKNIGVPLGRVNDGLVTIDFDDDDSAQAFMTENPQ